MNTFFFFFLLITSIQYFTHSFLLHAMAPSTRPLYHIVSATLYGENINLKRTHCTQNFIDLINLRRTHQFCLCNEYRGIIFRSDISLNIIRQAVQALMVFKHCTYFFYNERC
ncbi:hypothetical protein CY34DRAFT_277007 [Suillus luteus UH-Slu-Lm8-n1]|uniref:Unplaced genomic scaffold CY34scaffold_179, whole genome shotgun sequence n=1 Tax=Suillus luteus UH-Slu-Lm8-n1 TaxID=930992 RepID=A0A0D0B930_9AGAM|nr:hypothetical protein CY34DRAFT_277007 [Suillus luteus UH-Slu-Lm8-n1]